MVDTTRRELSRRSLLLSSAALLIATSPRVHARVISGVLPWEPNGGNPPAAARPGPWQFFTADEGRAMEALADRIITPDPQTPGGKDSGSAVFVDRQLAGSYGAQDGLYLRPPFLQGMKNQGHQSATGPRQQYREGLAALDRANAATYAGKHFADLSDGEKVEVLHGIEKGSFKLDGIDGGAFFDLAVKDVKEGFLADPIYGGNRDMAAWKMIGFPGARYNYLDWVDRPNERPPLPPASTLRRAEPTRAANGRQ